MEIRVWYGGHQRFGHLGVPHRWVNILGDVTGGQGDVALAYRLNAGPENPLSLGPDGLRLRGPGGLFHALRQIPLHLDIAHDIEALCPDAIVMVCSNPLSRICLAMHRHSSTGQIVGLCHGAEMAVHLYLNRILDIDGDEMEITAAGVNHFTWLLDIRHATTGDDLYPLLRETLRTRGFATTDSQEQPLSRKMLEVYGYFPATLDSHFGEYLPYAYEFVDVPGIDFEAHLDQEQRRWQVLANALGSRDLARDAVQWNAYRQALGDQAELSEELRLDDFFAPRSWADTLAFPIIAAIEGHTLHRVPALNLLNCGIITNLPGNVFVEAPAVVDASGIHPLCIGDLPHPLAAFCLRHYVDALHAHNPDFEIASNWAYSSFMPEPVEIDVDFISGDYTLQDSVNSARFEGRCMVHQGKPWDLMAWAFKQAVWRGRGTTT